MNLFCPAQWRLSPLAGVDYDGAVNEVRPHAGEKRCGCRRVHELDELYRRGGDVGKRSDSPQTRIVEIDQQPACPRACRVGDSRGVGHARSRDTRLRNPGWTNSLDQRVRVRNSRIRLNLLGGYYLGVSGRGRLASGAAGDSEHCQGHDEDCRCFDHWFSKALPVADQVPMLRYQNRTRRIQKQ